MAIANAKIRTEDVVEILDSKILATSAHPNLGVLPGENYDAILDTIELQILSPAEKAAFDNTLSTPSASNPVVLKEDLQTYVPEADLGEIKDSVATFANLPLTGNSVGDLRAVIADEIIYRWNGTVWTSFIHTGTLDHTQLINLNGDPNNQHISLTELTSLVTQMHQHANLAILNQIISAGSGQIITTAERAQLPTADQKAALAGTSGVPSATNPYVTNQDTRLNTVRTPFVTVGPPGSLATYSGVDAVPFNNALVAINAGSATAVKAIEVLPGVFNLGGAVLTWDSNDSAILIEAFTPGSVTLSFQTFEASINALLPGTGALTVRGFIFELNALGTTGILSQRANTLIEDCVFMPGPTLSVNQVGIVLEGANSVVRRCSFLNQLQIGVQIAAPNCRVEECTFDLTNPQNLGVQVLSGGTNAIIDHNFFVSGKIAVADSFAQISNNTWVQASTALTCTISNASPALVSTLNGLANLNVVTFTTTGVLPAPLLVGHRYFVRNVTPSGFNLSSTASGSLINTTSVGSGTHTVLGVGFVLDSGYSTRYIENLPADFNQPYVGVKRTIGPPSSCADYKTTTEVGFLSAFDDFSVSELEILPGTYTFSNTVNVPSGCRVRGVSQNSQSSGAVSIVGASGVTLFNMNSDTTLENLNLTGSNADLVAATSSSNVFIERCTFMTTSASLAANYGASFTSCSDYKIFKCNFLGLYGLLTASSLRGNVLSSVFNCTDDNFTSTTSLYDHIKDNFFLSSLAPNIGGNVLIVEGNHFIGNLPTKLGTLESVWQSNYPSPQANNVEGIDSVVLSLEADLQPYSGPVSFSEIGSLGSLSFGQSAVSSVATLPVKIGARVNELLGFSVTLNWTADVFAGAVMWQVTPVFRDANSGTFGSSSSIQMLSLRTGLTINEEDSVSFNFTTLAYGGTLTPTHVSLIVTRIGTHPSDDLLANAQLIAASISLPRD